MTASLDALLSRLARVRETKPGAWSAICPAHKDRNPSLSIAIAEDGRILVHCFAGCSLNAVTGALGLELSDLFPPRPIGHARSVAPNNRPRLANSDAIEVIKREIAIVALAGEDVLCGHLSSDDRTRLRKAVRRLYGVLSDGGFL